MTLFEELNLVEQAKSDLQAFNQIYEYYFGRIYAYCINRLNDQNTAQDITSQVFLSAVENIYKFNTKKNVRFGSWLYKVANSKIIDHYRKNKKAAHIDLNEVEIEDKDSINPHQELVKIYNQKKISSVLSNLKPRYQEVIALRFYSELEIEEIAGVLDMKPRQVSVLIHRALDSFRKKFLKKFPKSEIFDLN
jgi:RNA polymerase sigma-70 factor (ECF subfamily)